MKIDGLNVNPKITIEVITEAAERAMSSLDSPGFCLLCGVENGGVEPDARGNACESCGAPNSVYGAEALLISISY